MDAIKAGIRLGSLEVVGTRQRNPNLSLAQYEWRLNGHNLVTTYGERSWGWHLCFQLTRYTDCWGYQNKDWRSSYLFKEREKEDGFGSRNYASCIDYTWSILLWYLTNFSLSVPEISPEILRIYLSCQLFVYLFYLDTTLPMAASRWDLKQSCQQSSSGLLPFLTSLKHEFWIVNHEKAHIFFPT